jgi:hypothetical protein
MAFLEPAKQYYTSSHEVLLKLEPSKVATTAERAKYASHV